MAEESKSQEPSSAPPESTKAIRLGSGLKRLVAGLVLLAAGSYAAAVPWVGDSPVWDWIIRYEDDLTGAEVNADVSSFDGFQPVFHRRGARYISVISRPLTVHGNGRPVVQVIVTNVIDAPGAVHRRVVVFWQTGPNEPFRMQEAEVESGPGRLAPILILPVDARNIYRIGVQIPDATEACIHGIIMCPGFGERLGAGVRELGREELFGGESVNFYRGLNLLGGGISYYLISFCGIGLGLLLLISALRRKPVRYEAVAVAVLLPWIAGDIFFSIQLGRRAIAEGGTLRSIPPDRAIRAVYGEDSAIAANGLKLIPIGSRVSVLAQDSVTTAHRLAYLAAPHVMLVDHPNDADFIVVMDGAGVIENEKSLVLRDTQEQLPIRIIERWPGGALVERVRN